MPSFSPNVILGLKVAVLMMISSLFVSFGNTAVAWGMYAEGGLVRDFVFSRGLAVRTNLNATPEHQRGLQWRLASLGAKLLYDLPAFVIGFEGDRALMYDALEKESVGNFVGFRDSFVILNHSAVSDVLDSNDQPRGVWLGAAEVPARCMGQDTLIFVGTGEAHTATRRFLIKNVPAWTQSDFSGASLLDLDYGEDAQCAVAEIPEGEYGAVVKRALVRTLFNTMFEGPIDAETLQAFMEYATWGGTCVLGSDFHALTGGLALRKVAALRKVIAAGVLASPLGQRIKVAAARAAAEGLLPNATAEERSGDAIIRQLADGVAFAGMLGTSHLTTHALARLQSDPRRYVPLFDSDPVGFLHEEARVDPPVTSVTGVLREHTDVHFHRAAQKTTFSPGTPYQLVLSTANKDPEVFGGKFHSKSYSSSFDPSRDHSNILSWNGRLEDVAKFEAPRGCPGYKLSMLLAKSLVTAFKPAVDAVPKPGAMGATGRSATMVDEGAVDLDEFSGSAAGESAAMTVPKFLDAVGFLLWMGCCFSYTGWLLAQKHEFGPIATCYLGYVLAQAGVGVGFLVNRLLFLVSQVTAATMYMLICISCTCQYDRKLGLAASAVVWVTCAQVITMVSFTFYTFGPIGTLQPIVSAYYFVGSMMGVYSIYSFHKLAQEQHSTALARLRNAASDKMKAGTLEVELSDAEALLAVAKLGVKGAFFGIFDLIFVPVPQLGHLISRVLDSTLYVPNVLPAILAMDKVHPNVVAIAPPKRMYKHCVKFLLAVMGITIIVFFVAVGKTRDMCAFAITRPLNDEICTDSELSRVDLYGRVMYKIIVFSVDETPEDIAAQEDPSAVSLPKYEYKLNMMEAIPNTGWEIPTEDEDVKAQTWWVKLIKDFVIDDVFGSPVLFPIVDSPVVWSNFTRAKAIMKAASGHLLPRPVADWKGIDVTSDDAIAQMCFAGLAGNRVRLLEQPDDFGSEFVVDFSELAQLPVRAGFERFGASAYFNANQEITRIRWRQMDILPGQAKWAHAKWVFRCSALVGITANEHLLQSHLMFSNIAATASREFLPSHHPLRRLVKPFTHRTPQVNLGAQQFLTREFSLLHRTTALTFDGLQAAFRLSLKTAKLNPMMMYHATHVLTKGAEKNSNFEFPYAEDGQAFFQVIQKFVSGYVDIYYTDEEHLKTDHDLKEFWQGVRMYRGDSSGIPPWSTVTTEQFKGMIAAFIVQVTGIHHVVGNVAEYLISPEFASPRIRPNAEVSDVEASHYGLMIAILTGMKAPLLISDFKHLLLVDDKRDQAAALFDTFQADLEALALEIDARNEKRKHKFFGFHPRRLLSSISI